MLDGTDLRKEQEANAIAGAGLLDIGDSVRLSFAEADDLLKSPDAFEQKLASERELRADIKRLTLVLLAHQRVAHSSLDPENP